MICVVCYLIIEKDDWKKSVREGKAGSPNVNKSGIRSNFTAVSVTPCIESEYISLLRRLV